MLLKEPAQKRGAGKERILRVLLNHSGQEITKYRLAKEAKVSEPWCREYTENLERRGVLEETTVCRPRELYQEWQSVRIDPNQLTISLQQPMTVLDDTDLKYGLTTYRAENLIQGMLFPSTTDFYVHPDEIEDWLNLVEERGLLGGGNTRLRVLDTHVFYNTQQKNDVQLVSTPQIILDLLKEGGPCEEAATKLIDTVHGEAHSIQSRW